MVYRWHKVLRVPSFASSQGSQRCEKKLQVHPDREFVGEHESPLVEVEGDLRTEPE